jgi:hypothetical protein
VKKIPHAQGVTRAIRNVRVATKKALRSLNQTAGQKMARGDYSTAELHVAKGREVRQFQDSVDELLRAWRAINGRGAKADRAIKDDTTPLWDYYQPILRAIVAAGGACSRDQIEAACARSDGFLRPGDRAPMSGGRLRWQVMIRRARKPLRVEGWIQDGVGKTWRITQAGRLAAEREAGEGR